MTNDTKVTDPRKDRPDASTTPEDVAGLFSWANLEGSKYRDFSTSRTKSRSETLSRLDDERSKKAQALAAAEPQPPEPPRAATPVALPATGPQRLALGVQPRPNYSQSSPQVPGPRRVAPAAKRGQREPSAVASPRWTALKNVFDQDEDRHTPAPRTPVDLGVPAVAFISLAGGVGKTSLVASLGCALADAGESVLLVDTNAYSLLPFYFGASESTRETVRTFASNTSSAPIQVVTMESAHEEHADIHRQSMIERIVRHTHGVQHILIDVSTGSTALLRQALRLSPKILVVLTPDMASVVSLQAVQSFLEHIAGEEEQPLNLFYLLNQFDPSLRLHMDVRALLTRQLGERMLPLAIHRSSAFSEALAEGMTVMDYSPSSQVADDIHAFRQWLCELDGTASAVLEDVRWRER